jgi:hypothetical protein
MGNSAIIEVVIGVIFVYSLLSILVTQINTLIGNILNTRSRRLKEGMVELLSDPVIRAKIMSHPLIGMVEDKLLPGERITSEKATEMTSGKETNVAWVETATFVDVLTDVLTSGGAGQKLYTALNKAVDTLPASTEKSEIRELIRKLQVTGQGLPELRTAIQNLPNETHRQAMLDALNLVEDALDKLQVESTDLIPILIGIRQIQDPYFQRALEAVLSTAHSLEDAQGKLGKWFDNSMDHVTTLYKRYMQTLSLVIGLVLALVLNADTLQLGQALWEDPALRQGIATAAAASAENLSAQQETPAEDVGESIQDARGTLDQLLNLRLPLGWEIIPVTEEMVQASAKSPLLSDPYTNSRNLLNLLPGGASPYWLSLLIQKIIGLLITMIAVAQGAPFWFDMLNRLTGKK